ncbi:MAG: class I SAM-dependent methyltransferase [Bryobacteraceae bacterium]
MTANASLDFGYPWWLSYGHLVILIPAVAALAAGLRFRWPRWLVVLLGVTTIWSVAAMGALNYVGINSRGALPTANFFRAGEGKVLDIGAGTGRSSIMLLEARPKATLIALDQFGESFEHHFGHGPTPQERLQANLNAAGVANRASITTSDMRKLPFDDASFDAIISAYAVDHLPREGVKQALAEAHRVLKPGSEFLLMLVHNDRWIKFAFGPALSHGGTRNKLWWNERLKEAGFQIAEEGTAPATLYFLLRR